MQFGKKLAGSLRGIAPDACFVLGAGLVVYAIYLLMPFLALLVAGVIVVLVGIGMKSE